MSKSSEATASVETNIETNASVITISLQGEAGRNWVEDPERPGIPMIDDPIEASASGTWDGTIYFDSTELGLADGTSLDVTLSTLALDFDETGLFWQCTFYRGDVELAVLDSKNPEATVQALVGETDLRLRVDAADSVWGYDDSFDHQLHVAISANPSPIPEPATLAMLILGVLTLWRRPRR